MLASPRDQPSLAGDEGYVDADLGDSGLAQVFHQHVAVMSHGAVPGIEQFESVRGTLTDIFDAKTAARTSKPLFKANVAEAFLLEHVKTVCPRNPCKRRIKS